MTVTTVINGSIELHIEPESELENVVLTHFKKHLEKGGNIDVSTEVNHLEIILKAPK